MFQVLTFKKQYEASIELQQDNQWVHAYESLAQAKADDFAKLSQEYFSTLKFIPSDENLVTDVEFV